MSKSKCYVGIDVGKDELWAAVAARKPRCFKHTRRGIEALHRWARRVSGEMRVHLCMEATGVYSTDLAMQLYDRADTEISIINPAQIKAFAQATLKRTKTDGVDARVILEFAVSQQPSVWSPESKAIRQLYQLVAQAEAIGEAIRQWKNRDHAHGYVRDLPPAVRQSQRAIIRNLERQLAKIKQAITDLYQADQILNRQVQMLCTIPGIAETTAVRLLAYGKSALTERSQKALTAHAGLAPGHRQSGTSLRGKSRISKHGNSQLRKTLYMPAMCAIVHNPVIRRYYHHLLEKGKMNMVALTACMRKLLLIARAILIKNQTFDPEYSS